MKILLATSKPFAVVAVKQIREVFDTEGYDLVLLENYRDTSELLAAVADADALIVRSDAVTAQVLDAAKQLRIVVRAGAGFDNIDLNACTERNVVAMNTPGQNSNAVAELAFQMMLYQARGGFAGKTGTELRGKTIGLHGFGNVARCVARIAGGFGMTVSALDPFIGDDVFSGCNVRRCDTIEDLYSCSQYISLHTPATEETRKSVGYDLLSVMPENAVLVNTARKEIVDEEALLKIFSERSDFVYLSDIAPDSSELFEEKYKGRFIFTAKKMGAQTEEANVNAGIAAARQIADYFKTGNEKFRLNK
jgi:D-3-phosphoglycerate dehydrogenase